MTTDMSTGTDTSTTQQAKETASTAADEGRHVAGVATSEARGVASEAAQQARGVVADAMSQVRGTLEDQGRQQKERLAGTLSTFGDDLDRMAERASGLAADLAREAAERAKSLSRHLDQREPGELVDDVRGFARQRPGTFLVGALAAGVVVGRLMRGTKDAVEAAEAQGSTGTGLLTTPPTTTRAAQALPGGAPDTGDVHASQGQPTQPPPPPITPPSTTPPITPPTTPPTTGYSTPPLDGGPNGPQTRAGGPLS
jgi:hypothetical protein